jgi:SAM-dependent methyltransferase
MKAMKTRKFGKSSIRAHDTVLEILKNSGTSGKILDAPAGTGIISKKLKDIGFEVYPADIAPEVFKAPGLTCKRIDLNEALPYEDEFFDYILCSNGIEHLENQYFFVREAYRVLKPKGKLLITTPNILKLRMRIANLFTGKDSFRAKPMNEVDNYMDPGHINSVDYYDLRINLHRNGFKIIVLKSQMYSMTSLFFSFLVPFIYFFTYRSFRREKDERQRERNKEILRHVLSKDVLFGKKIFVLAEKNPDYLKKSVFA